MEYGLAWSASCFDSVSLSAFASMSERDAKHSATLEKELSMELMVSIKLSAAFLVGINGLDTDSAEIIWHR